MPKVCPRQKASNASFAFKLLTLNGNDSRVASFIDLHPIRTEQIHVRQ